MLVGGVNPTGRVTLSCSEKEFIAGGVCADLRADGRGRKDWRAVSAELGPVPQAAGSARLKVGGTDVIVSVKGDIGRPFLDKPDQGTIICTVDSSTVFSMNTALGGSSSGGGSNEDRHMQQRNDELSSILDDIFVKSGAINLKMLSIISGKHCWVLYLDVLVLDYDGNLIDTIVMATRLALSSMRLPRVRVEESGEATEVVLAEEVDTNLIIEEQYLPITITIGIIGTSFVLDPSGPEEICCNAGLLISLSQGNVVAMRKLGSGMLDPGLLSEYISTAQEASKNLASLVDHSHGHSPC